MTKSEVVAIVPAEPPSMSRWVRVRSSTSVAIACRADLIVRSVPARVVPVKSASSPVSLKTSLFSATPVRAMRLLALPSISSVAVASASAKVSSACRAALTVRLSPTVEPLKVPRLVAF